METILIASPDKISLNMAHSYFLNNLGRTNRIHLLSLNTLVSAERNERIYKDTLENTDKIDILLIMVKTKKKVSLEDTKCLQSVLLESSSDLIITLDLFAVIPRVLKDRNSKSKDLLSNWDSFIKSIEKS